MTTGGCTWANDNKTVFFTRKNPTTLRSEKIVRHKVGTSESQDAVVYSDMDETFNVFVYKSKSKDYIFFGSSSTLSSEFSYISANEPEAKPKVFTPRQSDFLYSVDHRGDQFYVYTNWNAKNFKLMKTSLQQTERSNWQELIAHREDVLLEGMDLFNDYMVLSERKNGLNQLRIINEKAGTEHYLDFGEPAYDAYSTTNLDMNTQILRYAYNSMTTPSSVYDYNMESKDKKLLKQQEVVGGYNSSDYVTERLYAPAKDGTQIPISLVYKKGFKKDGNAPTLLYGYGSYGNSMDASFSVARISLLNRGFCFAIAHIRGGQEMGRQWYEDGKMFKKINTFTDFIDCGEFLIKEKFTSPAHLYAMGGSAGGLLMGAVINMRPDLFNGVVAQVPFVDVVTTMLDTSIPLTTGEFDEWGNPANKDSYDYMKSYSPYDNIKAQDYPHLLITTGLHDSQVQYFEPAKWIAKLREMRTNDNLLIMDCNMETGHGGASGRFKSIHDVALGYAFLLYLEGITK
jgi:oligopeptidase B